MNFGQLPINLHQSATGAASGEAYDAWIKKITSRISDRGLGLKREIALRNLYFRVSIIGSCNLSCPFCHNEGGPKNGLINKGLMQRVMLGASELGYDRVQFTGGEPLIHPKLPEYVRFAKTIFPDVGVTTNGTFLEKRIHDLCECSINRIHISLQEEEIANEIDGKNEWITPRWLMNCLSIAREYSVRIKLNLPVRPSQISSAERFIAREECARLSIQLFSILPTTSKVDDSVKELLEIADAENSRRTAVGAEGRILVRRYLPPSGIRCETCADMDSCKEQSHSLRYGVDGYFRPCLASRDWDVENNLDDLEKQLLESSLMAIDYAWPEFSREWRADGS